MKKMLVIMSIVSLFIGLILIYAYPIQRALAMNKFYKYIELQGTSVENMSSMKIYKDYKRGGYKIRVIYKDEEPRIIYYYHYDIIKRDNNGKILINNMNLEISCRGYNYSINKEWNKKNGLKVKYPPLKDYR